MSNSLLNYHIADGSPAGEGATLCEIADYYGDLLFEIRPSMKGASYKRNDLREKLADYAHRAWSGWMDYLFSNSCRDSDGSVIIPRDLVSRWRYQIGIDYADLLEEMKESDQKEADKILAIISQEK